GRQLPGRFVAVGTCVSSHALHLRVESSADQASNDADVSSTLPIIPYERVFPDTAGSLAYKATLIRGLCPLFGHCLIGSPVLCRAEQLSRTVITSASFGVPGRSDLGEGDVDIEIDPGRPQSAFHFRNLLSVADRPQTSHLRWR